jgi:hypothetical protein
VGFFSRGGEARWGELRRRPGDDAAVSKDLTALLAERHLTSTADPLLQKRRWPAVQWAALGESARKRRIHEQSSTRHFQL